MLDPRDELIERHEAFVRRIVIATVRTFGLPKESTDEYISAAYMGLLDAADRFDPSLGKSFEGFAFRRIRGAVIDLIRSNSDVTGASYKAIKALRALDNHDDAIAVASNDSDDDVMQKIFSFSARGFLAVQLSGEKNEKSLKNVVDDSESAELQVIRDQRYQSLQRIVKKLPEKEQYIVQQHYFLGRSFAEIVQARPDLSKSWVSRLHTRALDLLAQLIREHGEL